MKIKYSFHKSAEIFFERHKDIELKFKFNIENFFNENIQCDIIKMRGYKDTFRMRVGNYRVIYTFSRKGFIIVYVVNAGPRGDIYKKL